ncbi:MAG: polysaccharide biosynthesis tyrosine autokinase, partial [Acidimicrobiales bacterium]
PNVSAVPVGQTDVIAITASDTYPAAAATIANTYARTYIAQRRSQDVNNALASAAEVQGKITDLQSQIDSLRAQINNAKDVNAATAAITPQLDSLTQEQGTFKQQLADLQVEAALNSGDAQLVKPATTPTSPASPRPLRDAILAIAAGLILGVGAALVLDQLDDSIKSPDDLERTIPRIPNLAVIPYVGAWKAKDQTLVVSVTDPKAPAAEAYRSLRTALQFAGLDRPFRNVQVTSPSQGEGKTTTLANLGVALAQVGQRVVLVDCDLRRPRIHQFFGLDNEVGFTSVVLGHVPADAALQDAPDIPGLQILPSGPLPPNPAEMLASSRCGEVLTALQAEADILLIDSPPVLPVTDAAVISGMADVTLLVVTAGFTTRRQAAKAVETLGQVEAPLLGTILNRAGARDAYGYGYGYGYRYYRYDRPLARRLDRVRRRPPTSEPAPPKRFVDV